MSPPGGEAQPRFPDFPSLLHRHGVRPDKRLGQHFLFDPAALHKVVAAAGLRGDETVLEVGAGVGSLTCRLAEAAGRVIAVEIDRRLIPLLQEAVRAFPNIQIVQGDVLSLDLEALVAGGSYLVVANIPYQITSQLIRWLLEARRPPRVLVLTIQREVAERVVAQAGEISLLALSVQMDKQTYLPGEKATLQANELARASGVTGERVIVEGNPASEILRIAEDGRADIIVIGSIGKTGLEKVLMGSVAEKLVHSSKQPVLVVR